MPRAYATAGAERLQPERFAILADHRGGRDRHRDDRRCAENHSRIRIRRSFALGVRETGTGAAELLTYR